MSSNHKATFNVQNYCKCVNNFLINDAINCQKQLFLSCSNTFRLYCTTFFEIRVHLQRNCGFGMTGSHDTDIDIYRYLCEASNLSALHYRPPGLKVPDCPAALGVHSVHRPQIRHLCPSKQGKNAHFWCLRGKKSIFLTLYTQRPP